LAHAGRRQLHQSAGGSQLTPSEHILFEPSLSEYSILRSVDTASSKPSDLVLPVDPDPSSIDPQASGVDPQVIPTALLEEFWIVAKADALGLTRTEFAQIVAAVGAKLNYNQPPDTKASATQKAAFYRSLHLTEFALAQACALGREPAWQLFISLHRAPLIQVATAITGSATLGQELADSLYAELYGLRERNGERRSPLITYSGRGSLAGWLRTTLVQRFRDHHRRTHREAPLEGIDSPASPPYTANPETTTLARAVSQTLQELVAEDRFLLVAYYLDRQTLLQIAQTIHVHEATISRRLKRLVASLRKQVLRNLCTNGLSRSAAEEALGTDPRDIEINLRALLQTSQVIAFQQEKAASDRL
jgi:RNA polymerase sigma-70 factor, ECF subfamily